MMMTRGCRTNTIVRQPLFLSVISCFPGSDYGRSRQISEIIYKMKM